MAYVSICFDSCQVHSNNDTQALLRRGHDDNVTAGAMDGVEWMSNVREDSSLSPKDHLF
jgi:hypothetical protein